MIKNLDVMKCQLVKENTMTYQTVHGLKEAAQIGRELELDMAADEYFYIVAVNAKGDVTGIHQISHGDLTSSNATPREVFKRAILNNAVGIVCLHNHPSGDPTPSKSDRLVTERLIAAGEILGVKVMDHVIIGMDGRYYSFVEHEKGLFC